jgi:hypothetical protein
LPNVDNITIEDEYGWVNGCQVPAEFIGPAAIGSEVDIRYYGNVDFSFFQREWFSKNSFPVLPGSYEKIKN